MSSSNSIANPACPVCISDYNEIDNVLVKCERCDYTSCRDCYKHYILTSPHEARCMNCNAVWTRSHLYKYFPKSFINGDLKRHIENLLLEREKARLPETLHLVVTKKQMEESAKEAQRLKEEQKKLLPEVEELDQLLKDLNLREFELDDKKGKREAKKEKSELVKQKKEKMDEYNQMTRLIREKVYYSNHGLEMEKRRLRQAENGAGPSDAPVEEKRKFIRPCPAADCRGFLSTQWKCELCDTRVCKDCHEIKKDEHTCKKEDLETAQLLAKDTKPCPKCATPIFKISGCDQMFCTECHTPFSWSKGKIETGVIHNPHYFEWRRQQGEDIGAVDARQLQQQYCRGGPLDEAEIYGDKYGNRVKSGNNGDYPVDFYQVLAHTQHALRREFRNNVEDNEDLRLEYLTNEIDEDKMKKMLQMRKKRVEKNHEFDMIFQMFVEVGGDLCRRYNAIAPAPRYRNPYGIMGGRRAAPQQDASIMTSENRQKALVIIEEMHALLLYVIDQLNVVGKIHDSVIHQGFIRYVSHLLEMKKI